MNEILPGVFHWSRYHERIRQPVNSYYVDELVAGGGATALDPMLDEEVLGWIASRAAPARVVLTNRHHFRHSGLLVERFGCPVLCERSGLHEFEGGPEDVTPYDFGDELAPGIVAHEVGAICSEDAVLHIAAGHGALAFADGLIRYGELGFVPDQLMDDPARVKRGVRESLARLVGLDFDSLLFAHGEPLVGGGKEALLAFLESGDERRD